MRNVIVSASIGDVVATNHYRCAEIRLIRKLMMTVSRKGVAAHAVASWVYRKWGAVEVTRYLADGSRTCSLPCLFCRHALHKKNLCWVAQGWNGANYTSDDRDCPPAVLTRSQKRQYHYNKK